VSQWAKVGKKKLQLLESLNEQMIPDNSFKLVREAHSIYMCLSHLSLTHSMSSIELHSTPPSRQRCRSSACT